MGPCPGPTPRLDPTPPKSLRALATSWEVRPRIPGGKNVSLPSGSSAQKGGMRQSSERPIGWDFPARSRLRSTTWGTCPLGADPRTWRVETKARFAPFRMISTCAFAAAGLRVLPILHVRSAIGGCIPLGERQAARTARKSLCFLRTEFLTGSPLLPLRSPLCL